MGPFAVPADIEIFRAGRHTAANGETLSFSEADLAGTAASYDPALHQAPLAARERVSLGAISWRKGIGAPQGVITDYGGSHYTDESTGKLWVLEQATNLAGNANWVMK